MEKERNVCCGDAWKRIRRAILPLTLLFLMLAGFPAAAQEKKVVDMADLLTQKEEERLQDRLSGIVEEYQCDVAVVTTESIDGSFVEEYAENYYDNHGYGIGSDWTGILLFISMEERDWNITAEGKGTEIFTDYGRREIGDRIVGMLSDGDYFDAFMKFADLSEEFLRQAATGTPYDVDHTWKEPMSLGMRLAISAGAALVVTLIVFAVLVSQLKSVGYQSGAREYVRRGSFHLTRSNDLFLYRTVSRRKIEDNPPPSGGGGSTTHTTSSGHTASSTSGKF